jgi:hypothetical protein
VSPLPLDHLVYAAPDLDAAVAELEKRLGVRAAPGGSHPGLGTRNALLALSADSYLEVIAPDPAQPEPARPRPFGIDALAKGRLVTWAARAAELEVRVEAARAAGYDPGFVVPVSRAAPDGRKLAWRLTVRPTPGGDGLVPFLIDWGSTPHPAGSAPPGCALLALRGEHPDPERVARDLSALGASLPVTRAAAVSLVALVDAPAGRVELR